MIDLLLVLQVILIVAKLAGLITISWWGVLVPVWLILIVLFIVFVIACIEGAN